MSDLTQYLAAYSTLWQNYEAYPLNRTLDHTDKENRFDTDWQLKHYFSVGRDALRIIVGELVANGLNPPASILDFPSGSGRVTRHLRAMFPEARIGACDLYESHISFCAEEFGAIPLLSRERIAELDVGQWDLIFCGSLLTHLPHTLFLETLAFLSRSLTDNGIAIATLEGRHALFIQDHKWQLIADDLFDVARQQYHETGFGFVDYDHGFRSAAFGQQESYGVALVNPSRIMGELQAFQDIRILGFRERAWDDHQDVVVFGRPGVNA